MDLESFRKSRGLTQEQLASELGLVSKGYVSRIETGDVRAPIKLALQIERWSGGEVRAVELLSPEDAGLLQAAIDAGREPATVAA